MCQVGVLYPETHPCKVIGDGAGESERGIFEIDLEGHFVTYVYLDDGINVTSAATDIADAGRLPT
jgi:hypothetical protein